MLSTRARKDVKVADIKVQVCLFAFDCLYLDGAELLQRPLTERRAALYSAVNEAPGELLFATAKVLPRAATRPWQGFRTHAQLRCFPGQQPGHGRVS